MKIRVLGLVCHFEWRLLALHLVYFILLLTVYSTYVVTIYGYAGFKDALNINKAIISLFLILSAFTLLRNNGLPSYFFLNIIITLTITPSLVIFSGSDLPYSFVAVTWIAFAILAMVVRFIRLRRIGTKCITATLMLRLLAGLSLLLIASYFALGGGRFINFDLTRVYDFRRDAMANLPQVYGYLMSNFSKAIIPAGIVLSFMYRKWVLLLVFILSSVMLFALSSNKSPLFIPVVVIFVYWFAQHPKVIDLTLLGLISVVVIGGLDFYLSQTGAGDFAGWVGDLLVRRALLVTSLLNWSYYDFFSVHPKVYWAESKFTLGLIDSSYDVGIAELIGREVFGKVMHANTGWIGSGMANAGYLGVGLYSVLIALFLSLFDAYAKKLGNSLVVSVFLISVMTAAAGSDFTAVLLTHGFLLLLIIVTLLKPTIRQNHCVVATRGKKRLNVIMAE